MTELRDKARQEIAATAAAMVSGSVSYIEGARLIFAASFEADMEDDPDILPLVGIVSETDALPFGPGRTQWNLAPLPPFSRRLIGRNFGPRNLAANTA